MSDHKPRPLPASTYRELVDRSPLGVLVANRDFDILYANDAYYRLLGAPEPDPGPGRNLARAGALAQPAVIEAVRDCLEGGRSSSVETCFVSRWGKSVQLRIHIAPLRDAAGDVVGGQGILEDVSEERRAAELKAQLHEAQKMEALGQLAGGVAHDFNNLLTVILGNAESLLEQLAYAGPAREDADQIRRAAQRAADLTRQLLAFSRRQHLEPQTLDLSSVVAGLEGMLSRLVPEAIEFSLHLDPSPTWVRAERVQLEQFVLNLVVNSRDAIGSHGSIQVRTGRLAPGPEAGLGEVTLSVSDDGCGMDAETQAHIFEPFFTTKGPGSGTGLGLSTVYGSVSQSGGRMEVESEPERGTTIHIRLPAAAPALELQAELPPSLGENSKPGTILLVEDEEGVRNLMRRILEQGGYSVIEARDGREGLERAPDAGIDLLVTDVVMPRMNGTELCVRLRERFPDLPVILLSGYPEDLDGAPSLPPHDVFIHKPFRPVQLLEAIREVLASQLDPDTAD